MIKKTEAAAKQFTEQLVSRTQKAVALGAPGKRLLQQLERESGPSIMQGLIRRQRVSDTFSFLEKAGHLELSPEAMVTESAYGALFTDEEVNWCFEQLCDCGYFR